ncbi:MAG: gcrA cell cycle regulator family protein [Alphaproteobacteria bacterium]|nr:MAG: gcrA cell cycle regulator family protein [Alphaproteobacteria bacterium]
MSWTDDRVSILKKLWGDGHTAAEIAKKLGGVTRNAVIGKAHRLKLSNRVSPIQQNKKPANKNTQRKVVEKVKIVAAPSAVKMQPSAVVKDSPSVSGTLYSLLELKPRMCRWPSGDPREEQFGFCGETTISGIPYCEDHAKIAYQAATRNRILSADKEVRKVREGLVSAETKKSASGR